MVAVAQLVESRIVIPVVVGSSPIGHPKDSNAKPSSCDWALLFLEAMHALSYRTVATFHQTFIAKVLLHRG
jgi:hypothetical protein